MANCNAKRQSNSYTLAGIKIKVPTTIIVGQHYGHWAVLSLNTTGKRIACRCVCGRVCVLGVETIEAGVSTSCGCRPPTLQNRDAYREEQARQSRHRNVGDWKMEHGR